MVSWVTNLYSHKGLRVKPSDWDPPKKSKVVLVNKQTIRRGKKVILTGVNEGILVLTSVKEKQGNYNKRG